MLHALSGRARALLAVVSCLVWVLALTGAAMADEYGELLRVAGNKTGTGNGQLSDERTRLLGVDSTDNSVYVLDEPEKFTQAKKVAPPNETEEGELEECVNPITSKTEPGEINEVTNKCVLEGVGPITRHFRIQKFALSKGAYAFVASATFDEVAPEPAQRTKAFLSGGVEGIAVDPVLKRVYVLAADDRQVGLGVDGLSKYRGASNPKDLQVASTLYAFSTQQSGTSLPAAAETKAGGVLRGPGAGEFEAQSTTPGKALLQPAGITVDPNTSDVIVLGHVDQKGEATDNIENAGDHFALQRIGAKGELKSQYVDKTDFFKKAEEETEGARGPDSPVVAPAQGGGEHVYVNFEGLAEVPHNFAAEEAPHTVAPRLGKGVAIGPLSSVQVRLGENALAGGALSAAPGSGSLYAMGDIETNEIGFGAENRHGVLALSSANGAELGFAGGQVPVAGKSACVTADLEEAFENPKLPLRVAAGSGENVFVLNPELLKRVEGPEVDTEEEKEELAAENEDVKIKGPFVASVIELGPNGSGCPHPRATTPEAKFNNKPLTEKQPIPAGSSVTFTSSLVQGDALKVKWEFASGAIKETVEQSRSDFSNPTEPTVVHKFAQAGTYTVKETIETDNLAMRVAPPPSQEAEKVVVEGTQAATAELVHEPVSAEVGKSVTFTAKNPQHVSKYKWKFGDGGEVTTTLPETKHEYKVSGEREVSLTVVNAQGAENPAGAYKIKVEAKHEEPPHEEPPHEEPKQSEKHDEPQTPQPTVPQQEVKPSQESRVSPSAVLASTSLAVTPAGALVVKVKCPAGATGCIGTITLRTLNAVAATRKSILTLASGSFKVSGGGVTSVTLHLSAKARKLLAHSHLLRAKATIAAHDTTGASHTNQATVTLRATKAKRH